MSKTLEQITTDKISKLEDEKTRLQKTKPMDYMTAIAIVQIQISMLKIILTEFNAQ